MARRPPPQLPRHLLERPPIIRFPTASYPSLKRADLEFACRDEFIDVQCAILEGFARRLGCKGMSIASLGRVVELLLFVRAGFGFGVGFGGVEMMVWR